MNTIIVRSALLASCLLSSPLCAMLVPTSIATRYIPKHGRYYATHKIKTSKKNKYRKQNKEDAALPKKRIFDLGLKGHLAITHNGIDIVSLRFAEDGATCTTAADNYFGVISTIEKTLVTIGIIDGADKGQHSDKE